MKFLSSTGVVLQAWSPGKRVKVSSYFQTCPGQMGNSSSEIRYSEGPVDRGTLEMRLQEGPAPEYGSIVDLALDSKTAGLWKILRGEEGTVQLSFKRTPDSIEEAAALLSLIEKIQDLGSCISPRILDRSGRERTLEAARSLLGSKEERELAQQVGQMSLLSGRNSDRATPAGTGGASAGPNSGKGQDR